MQLIQILDELFDAAHDGISAPEGILAEKGIEHDGLVLVLVLEVALHHGQFIEIREQSQVLTIHNNPILLYVTGAGLPERLAAS